MHWAETKKISEKEDVEIPKVRFSDQYIMWLSRLLKKLPQIQGEDKADVMAKLQHLKALIMFSIVTYCNRKKTAYWTEVAYELRIIFVEYSKTKNLLSPITL